MTGRSKPHALKTIQFFLFAIYLFILIWALLFKLDFTAPAHMRSLNLIPYGASAIANGGVNLNEIILNITVFIPFGLLISLCCPSLKFVYKLLITAAATVLIEAFQFILQIGASDITDVINNILGEIIGIFIYKFFHHYFGLKADKTITIILLICLIILSILIIMIKIANL